MRSLPRTGTTLAPTTPAKACAAKRRRQISQAMSVLGTDEPVADGSRAA